MKVNAVSMANEDNYTVSIFKLHTHTHPHTKKKCKRERKNAQAKTDRENG